MSRTGWRLHDAFDIAGAKDKRKRGSSVDDDDDDGDEDDSWVVDDDDPELLKEEEASRQLKRYKREEIVNNLYVIDNTNLKLAPSTLGVEAGLGLFALRDFEPGEPITAYEGKVISHQEAVLLAQAKKASHLRTLIQLHYVLDGLRLADGTPITKPRSQLLGKGGAAMVNDNGPTGANAEFDFADDAENRAIDKEIETRYEMERQRVDTSRLPPLREYRPEGRTVFIRATKRIRKGDEIFVYYGEDYWKRQKDDPELE